MRNTLAAGLARPISMRVKSEIAKWAVLIKASGISMD
jgi:hypothetical protein